MPRFAGVRENNIPNEQRVDTRRWGDRMASEWSAPDGATILGLILTAINIVLLAIPLGPILASIPTLILSRKFLDPKGRQHDLPLRVPQHLKVPDGSVTVPNKKFTRATASKYYGKGVTIFGMDLETRLQVWGTDSDNRTHATVLGTTGSGKTEFIFGLLLNQLIEDSGFIAVDAKGDIAFQRRCCQLLRRFGREDDLLTISFAVGSRDFLKAQHDRPTNTFNIMSSTSAGMLIELLSGMLDGDGGGDDMWKGRAIAFIAAITRPLTYLRDAGEIELSPSKYMDYMELAEVERLVYEQASLYPGFDQVLKPLRGYLTTLPGYDTTKKMAQAQETNEQFGFITMQLTRAINDLGHNYGHIFGTEIGEIDISDVVLNRRCLTVLLPSLERSLPTLNMLGKLIIGAIKQMMAGSLGSKLEGLTRLTVDSRPTTANNSFRIILDEVGYMMVTGMSIIPAQARSLNISMTFAAQSYTDIKRGSAEEAEAIWDNSNFKFIGRIVGGDQSETWQKVKGAAGEKNQMLVGGYEQRDSMNGFKYVTNKEVRRESTSQVNYQDVAGQENGEFTIIVPKKYKGGQTQGVSVTRILGLYTGGGAESSNMYLNDLIPVSGAEPGSSQTKLRQEQLRAAIASGSLSADIDNAVLSSCGATLMSSKGYTGDITSLLITAAEEISAHANNPSYNNVVVETSLSLFGSTLKSIDSTQYYMPTNLQEDVPAHLDAATEATINSSITKTQAGRVVDNLQTNAYANDPEAQDNALTFVYDAEANDSDVNPFDRANPEKAKQIKEQLKQSGGGISSAAQQAILAQLSEDIYKTEELTDRRLSEHVLDNNVQYNADEHLNEQSLSEGVAKGQTRQNQLSALVSKQQADSLSYEMIQACIDSNNVTSSQAEQSVILDTADQEVLLQTLRSATSYILASKDDS